MTAWKSLLVWLAAMSADPNSIEEQRPRAHASYRVAYATFAAADDPEPTPQPAPPNPSPKPTPRPTREPAPVCKCGGTCSLDCSCGCRGPKAAAGTPCPDGKCQKPSAPRGG
jgi:hypothetical protein